jgi:hypothetical protein
MEGSKLHNAVGVISFCLKRQQEHLAYPNVRRPIFRFFRLIKLKDVDRSVFWDCKIIPRSRSFHSMAFVCHIDITMLNMRMFTCFCHECMDDNPIFCENKEHVEPWKLHTLEPSNITHVLFYY